MLTLREEGGRKEKKQKSKETKLEDVIVLMETDHTSQFLWDKFPHSEPPFDRPPNLLPLLPSAAALDVTTHKTRTAYAHKSQTLPHWDITLLVLQVPVQTGFPLPPQSILNRWLLSLLLPRCIIHVSSCIGQKWSRLPRLFSFLHIPHQSISKSCGLNVYNRSNYGRLRHLRHSLRVQAPPPVTWITAVAYLVSPHPCAANSCHTAARFYLFMLSRIMSLICSKSSKASHLRVRSKFLHGR